MKTLHLPLKKEWYEMIERGEKTEEYREIKPYWCKRFTRDFPLISSFRFDYAIWSGDFSEIRGRILHPIYKAVKFSYGYTKRTMTFELLRIRIGIGRPEWGAPKEVVFILDLGKRIE